MFAKIGQATLFNTVWMHQPNALKNMLAMFSKNKLKQGLFIVKYIVYVSLIPLIRKSLGLAPKQSIDIKINNDYQFIQLLNRIN
jgi:hypothetical protein